MAGSGRVLWEAASLPLLTFVFYLSLGLSYNRAPLYPLCFHLLRGIMVNFCEPYDLVSH